MVDSPGSSCIVHPAARIGRNVEIGPFVLIEADVLIGDGCVIGPQVVVRSGTEIGPGCRLGAGAVLGEPPMDFAYHGEMTKVVVGRDNDLREHVTIHRATGAGAATTIGDGNLIMPYVHVAHNCRIGSRVTITNACQLAGYVEVEDHAVLGGMTGVHQHVRVGAHAMAGACSYLARDLPPFMIGAGNPFRVRGVNSIGLRRANMPPETLRFIKEIHRIVYRTGLNLSMALNELQEDFPDRPELRQFVEFVRKSRRGLSREAIREG